MKAEMIQEICLAMENHLSPEQNRILKKTLKQTFQHYHIPYEPTTSQPEVQSQNTHLINLFIAAKKIEGCSDNTLKYYSNTLYSMVNNIPKSVCTMDTNDLRLYLADYQETRQASKVTLDNIRRIMSSFFSWLEDEDYILKSPVDAFIK